MQADPIITLDVEKRVMIEGVAAQMYEQDCCDKEIAGQPWGVVDNHIKKRWRLTALRKLRTGEVDGWYKVADPVAASRRRREACQL